MCVAPYLPAFECWRAFVWLTESNPCCYSADPEEDILEIVVDLAMEYDP